MPDVQKMTDLLTKIIEHCEQKSSHYLKQVPRDYDEQEAPSRTAAEAYGSVYTAGEIADFVRRLTP